VTSTIYLDTAAKVARAALTGTALPSVSAKLLSHLKLIIKCFAGADIVTVDSGTVKCVIKPKNAPSGAPSLIDTSAVFSGSGATAQYVFEWDSADSVALRAHIDAAADPTQPVELRCEVEYELDGNAERVAFPIHFETAYTRPEDPAPEANTDTSWEWLKLRAPETNGFSHDDEAKELTVAGGSGSGDVVGPASATDNAIVRFNGTGGKLVQTSGITIADGASGTLSGTNTGDQTAESLGLVIGTHVQAYNANLTTFAGIAPAANVQSLLGAADYAAMRTLLGLVIGTNVQAYSANLATFAGIAPAANVQSLLSAADYAAMRTLLGLVIGTHVQAYNANLTTFAGIAPAANVQSLLAAADYAAMRTLLGLVIGTNVQAFNSKLTTLSDGFGAFFLGTGIVRWTGSTYALQLDAIAASDGGTGQTSYTLGDILFAGQTGSITSLTKLAGNTENGVKKFLTQTGAAFGQSAAPQWSSIAPADLGTGSSIDGKYLRGDGTWQSLDLSAYQTTAGTLALAGFSSITGTLAVANGGTGITSLGTGVATALGINVGSAGAPVVLNGAGGTPSSLTLTNATGLPTAGLVDDAVTLAKMASGTAGNLITYDASGNPAAVATGTAGQVLTSNGAGAAPTMQNASGGLGGSTGSTDNALIRADGTGGATAQSSALSVSDLATASPNNTTNAVQLEVVGGTSSVDLVLTPKGTLGGAAGAFIVGPLPNATTTGNKRGANATEIQNTRPTSGFQDRVVSGAFGVGIGNQTCIVSGAGAVVIGGFNDTASGEGAVIIGGVSNNVASGSNSIVLGGNYSTASGFCSTSISGGTTASGRYSMAIGRGASAVQDGTLAFAHGAFGTNDSDPGSAQWVLLASFRATTTNATPTALLQTAFQGATSGRLSVPSGAVMSLMVRITAVKSDGVSVAKYTREVCIKNVSGTTSLVGSVVTIGTDHEDNASTDVSITADDTNDALTIQVTGIASETWRWNAAIEGISTSYGS